MPVNFIILAHNENYVLQEICSNQILLSPPNTVYVTARRCLACVDTLWREQEL